MSCTAALLRGIQDSNKNSCNVHNVTQASIASWIANYFSNEAQFSTSMSEFQCIGALFPFLWIAPVLCSAFMNYPSALLYFYELLHFFAPQSCTFMNFSSGVSYFWFVHCCLLLALALSHTHKPGFQFKRKSRSEQLPAAILHKF